MNSAIFTTNISDYPLIHRGKVRDIYEVDGEHLLIVATDRISAFDVILPTPIPDKGAVLKSVSSFWFAQTAQQIKNHNADLDLREVLNQDDYTHYHRHAVVVKKMQALPVEAIVRGYLIGSGWKDYQQTGRVCGLALPANLQLAEQLPNAIFTPSTKAQIGDHDENIDFIEVVRLLGREMAEQVRRIAVQIYQQAAIYAKARGIIIADTKFEFGTDAAGDLVLIDEVLTPDSSRFWPQATYQVGHSPASYDKQFVRDYLETLDWNKTAPGPELPDTVVAKTTAIYRQAKTALGIVD